MEESAIEGAIRHDLLEPHPRKVTDRQPSPLAEFFSE
jgi:hypothetical protein